MYHFSETLGTRGKLISSYGTVIEYRALDNDNFMKQAPSKAYEKQHLDMATKLINYENW